MKISDIIIDKMPPQWSL